MHVLGSLLRTLNGKQCVKVVTDRYSNSTSAFLTPSTTVSHTASLFMDNYMILYRIPVHLFTDNGTQFTSQCFEKLGIILGMKPLTTMV